MLKINKKEFLITGAVIILLVFFHYTGISSSVENVITRILNPIMSRAYFLGTRISLGYKRQTSKIDFAQKSEKLQQKVDNLMKENARLRAVEEENKLLREYLDFTKKKQFHYLMSNVISRGSFGSLSDRIEVITIDKGKRDGLYSGLAVVNSQGILVGKTANVKEATAVVYLTNNEKCKLAAVIQGHNGTNGIAQGELGLVIRMNFIPQTESIKTGDILITSGLEPTIPRSLVIGQVKEINKESNELWQNAIIESSVRPEDLIVVAVVFPGER